MPAFVLGTGIAGVMMRHTRGGDAAALSQDYVRTARAKGLPERVVVLKHALRNALIPVVTLGAHRVRPAAGRRGADRADLRHPRLRQADRRRGVQPRLRRWCRASCWRPRCLRAAQPGRRRALLRGQPAAADGMSAASASIAVAPARGETRRRAAPSRRFLRHRLAVFGLLVVVLFVAGAGRSRRWLAPADPIATTWTAHPQGALRGALVRHRRDRPRRAVPRALGRARLAAGRRDLGAGRAADRRAARAAGRARAAAGWTRSSRASPTPCSRCPFLILAIALAAFLGPEPRERHARDRHRRRAGLRPPGPRHGAGGEDRGLRRGRPGARQPAAGGSALRAHAAQHHPAAAGPGDAQRRRGDHRRGDAVVPRPRPAAAGAVLGQHAERGPALPRPRRPGWRSSRG